MTNSKAKGARGEREFVEFLRERGIKAYRSQQYCGANGDADVVSNLPVHWEVKRTEAFNAYKALEQAKADAKGGFPVVAHKRNRKPWVVVLDASDFLEIINARARYLDRDPEHLRGAKSRARGRDAKLARQNEQDQRTEPGADAGD